MQFIRILYDVFGFTPNSGLRLFGNAVPSPTSPVPQTQCSPTRGGGAQGLRAERAGAREGSPAASPPSLASRVTASAETCPPAALQLPSTPASHASVERRAAAGGEKGGLDEWGQ